jgi:Ca2+-binding RTX toxin-like protein
MGRDQLDGGANEDIVIGDATQADNNTDALFGILDRWNQNTIYEKRVDMLRPRTATVRRLPDLTLIADGASDTLVGGAGRDWFLSNGKDDIRDRMKDEFVN